MLAYAVELNAQTIGTFAVLGSGLAWVVVQVVKKYRADKTETVTAKESALVAQLAIVTQTAESWESLYRAERESHEHTKTRLNTLEGRVHTLEESHQAIMDLNLKHQETIREMGHTVRNLRQRLQDKGISHEDIK
jgi:hypothetical protein